MSLLKSLIYIKEFTIKVPNLNTLGAEISTSIWTYDPTDYRERNENELLNWLKFYKTDDSHTVILSVTYSFREDV